MNLLCVIDNLSSGGAQRQLVNVACGLKARGHHVVFFTYYPDNHFKPQLDRAGIPLHCCQKTSRWAISPVFALRRLIAHGSFDVIVSYLETPTFYSEIARVGIQQTRLVVSERNMNPSASASMEKRILGQAHRLADAVVTNSHAQRIWMALHFPFLRDRLVTIWNGTDTTLFHPERRSHHHGIHLLGVGRVSPQKNLIQMAEALGNCIRQGMTVTLDWAGRLEDEAYYKRVLRTIESTGISQAWGWLGERQDIPELMRRYDALILPSLWEGLPNVVCEAMASGLPVLASNISDNSLLVKDGEQGFLFPPNRPDAIADAIVKFSLLSECDQNRMSASSRLFAEEALTLEACVDAYERFLTSPNNFLKSR